VNYIAQKIKMRSTYLPFIFLLLSVFSCLPAAHAQFNSEDPFAPVNTGFLYSRGLANSTLYYEQIPDYGSYYTKARGLAMTANFQGSLTKFMEEKVSIGYYGGFTLGASRSYYQVQYYNKKDNPVYDALDFLGDMRLGLQAGYHLKEEKLGFGIRYFNMYGGESLRSTINGNADDGAVIGLFANYKKLGADFSLAPKGFPGILVHNVYNYCQAELRYKFGSWDDGNYAFYAGTRYDHTFLADYGYVPPATQRASANAIGFMLGICVND
jgi:hypothetical protein